MVNAGTFLIMQLPDHSQYRISNGFFTDLLRTNSLQLINNRPLFLFSLSERVDCHLATEIKQFLAPLKPTLTETGAKSILDAPLAIILWCF
jgi:hypothetical protein